jgi:hypothetical protein
LKLSPKSNPPLDSCRHRLFRIALAGSQKGLGEKLKTRGFIDHKRKIGQGFFGLRVRLREPDETGWEAQG